jgi:hypothetical protein
VNTNPYKKNITNSSAGSCGYIDARRQAINRLKAKAGKNSSGAKYVERRTLAPSLSQDQNNIAPAKSR